MAKTHAAVAVVKDGWLCSEDGARLEYASNLARNQFGYNLDETWNEVSRRNAVIWLEDDGATWTN